MQRSFHTCVNAQGKAAVCECLGRIHSLAQVVKGAGRSAILRWAGLIERAGSFNGNGNSVLSLEQDVKISL